MSDKPPKEIYIWTVEDMRVAALECIRIRNEENDDSIGIGISPEAMFLICNVLEDAGVEAIGARDDEDVLQLGFTENESDNDADSN